MPVLLERPWRAPEDVLSAFADEPWTCAFLSDGKGPRGRWSYVMRAPDATLTLQPSDTADAFAAVSDLLGPRRDANPDGPPFQGGLAGLAAYELGDRVESLGLNRHPDWPDMALGRYPSLLAFDHQSRRVLAIGQTVGQAEFAAEWL